MTRVGSRVRITTHRLMAGAIVVGGLLVGTVAFVVVTDAAATRRTVSDLRVERDALRRDLDRLSGQVVALCGGRPGCAPVVQAPAPTTTTQRRTTTTTTTMRPPRPSAAATTTRRTGATSSSTGTSTTTTTTTATGGPLPCLVPLCPVPGL